jgi:hypothetical protein
MSKKIRISETELTKLINRVISERELVGGKYYREDTCRCYWSDGSSNSVMCEGEGSGCGSLTEGVKCEACCNEHGMTAQDPSRQYMREYDEMYEGKKKDHDGDGDIDTDDWKAARDKAIKSKKGITKEDVRRLQNRVLSEDFEISGDEPATKTDLNNAVKHIISKLTNEIGIGSYGDYIK